MEVPVSELRELLGHALRVVDGCEPPDNFVCGQSEDITQRFFDDCSHLTQGEVIRFENFHLGEAMSAVELMDEKMDIGMKKIKEKIGLDSCEQKGLFECSLEEQLCTIDATFCAFVTWLEGSCIAQTLWTNVLLTEPNRVHPLKHPVFASLSHGFSHIVLMVRNIIQNASVYEEEDFNPHLPFSCTSMFSQSEVIDLLYKTEMDLSIEAGLEKSAEKRNVILSIVARLEFIRLFIVTISLLVPPQNKEPELELNEVASLNATGFRPNIENAVTSATRMITLSSKFLETTHLGIAWPENITEDDDFGWLTAFEPELNRRYMPSTFPRLTEIFRREIALPHLHRISCKIHFIASQTENNIEDVSTLMEYMKWFNYDESCTLTRSILQLVLFPLDDNILGAHPTAGLVENALRNSVLPFVFIPNTVASKNDSCRKVVEDFTMNTTRVMLSLFQNFGFNLARQRDKLVAIIEDMSDLQDDAGKADAICQRVMDVPTAYTPFATFAFSQTLNLIAYHMELSFRLELFAPYEYTYVYWYYGEVLCRWFMNALEKSQNLLLEGYKKETDMYSKAKKNKKKIKNRPSIEEHIRMRVAIGHGQMILRCGHCKLSEAIVRISVALRKLGKINVPMWNADSERLRFEHRMSGLSNIGPPLHMSYADYLIHSKVEELCHFDESVLLKDAIESFDAARLQFEKLEDRPEMSDMVKPLIRVCRSNVVATRMLVSGKVVDRRFEWQFPADSPMFPVLKMSTHPSEPIKC